MDNLIVDQVLWFLKIQINNELFAANLFCNMTNKCQCCFCEIPDGIVEKNFIENWHREAFYALTNIEISDHQNSSHVLCINCASLLRVFTEFRKYAGNIQKRFNGFLDEKYGDKDKRNEFQSHPQLQIAEINSDFLGYECGQQRDYDSGHSSKDTDNSEMITSSSDLNTLELEETSSQSVRF